ncbi:subtilisin-like serine protease [Tulasnella sp. UAMH 9824]|nr:subtilisin-like serine protease [Tulasnella sp. UAMH 9824]
MYATAFLAVLFGATAIDSALGAAVPSYVSRHRARHASMPGLQLINGQVKTSSYIVKLADNVSNRTAHLDWANSMVAESKASGATSVQTFNQTVFDGYSAELDDDCVAKLIASKDVAWVEEDAVVRITGTQTNAPWGLSRLSSSTALPANSNVNSLTFDYTFNDEAGNGIDVYVIDTGIRVTHTDYEGRAEMIFSLPGLAKTDDNGHGSHVSGTIAGKTFGVAKKASLFGIKVMDADGSGSTSGIIQGIQVAMQAAADSKRPSVINMSIGGAGSRALDSAATAAVNAGMFVVVAAGNDAVDAGNDSPARAPAAITVGAANIRDRVSTFSNFGSVVDIFAPGEDIISCGITSDTDVASLSGTSMATPHIAGLVALLASQQPDITPAGMTQLLKSMGTTGALRGIPSRDTINLLAQNLLPDQGIATTSTSLISTTAARTATTAENATTTLN